MIRKLIAAMCVSAMLVGCGGMKVSPLEDNRDQIQIFNEETNTLTTIDPRSYAKQLQADIIADCKALEREESQAKWDAIGELESSLERLVAINGAEWADALKEINGQERCVPGTNEYDAFIAWAEANEKIYTVAIKETGSTVRFGVGALAGYGSIKEIAGAIGDKIGGDQIKAGQSAGKASEEASVEIKSDSEYSESKDTQVAHDGDATMVKEPKEEVAEETEEETTEEEI